MNRESLTPLHRTLRLLATICQLAVTVLLPVIEARAESLSGSARSHIEETSSRACPPIHVDSACQICRAARNPALLASADPLPDLGPAAVVALRVWRENAPDVAFATSLHSRAPPAA